MAPRQYNNNTPKPTKEISYLLDHGLALRDRLIYLTDSIEGDIADLWARQIHYLSNGEDWQKPIKIIVNSFGGDEDCMLYLYDAITTCASPIHTIGTGMVCSAAALLLVAGDKRFATENCWFMTHKSKISMSGDDDEIQAGARLQKKLSTAYWRLLERHTIKTADFWLRRSKDQGESWLDVDKMLEYGVIDGIIKNTRSYESVSKRILAALKHREIEDDDDEDHGDD